TRRTVLTGSLGLAAGAATSLSFLVPRYDHDRRPARSRVAILPAIEYSDKLCGVLWEGLRLFRLSVAGKSVLLKPNLVDYISGALQRALHFADVYNWSDAAREFSEAEKLFLAAGDQRNALFARLSKIRSTAEQRNLPSTSAELGTELDTNPILQTDKQLRMF